MYMPPSLVGNESTSLAHPGVGWSRKPSNNGVFWRGADGQVYVKGHKGVNAAGNWDGNTTSYWTNQGFSEIADPNAPAGKTTNTTNTPNNPVDLYNPYNPGGSSAKELDQASLDSLIARLESYKKDRDTAIKRAKLERDAAKREKEREKEREEGKYKGEKLSTLQEFGGAKTDTDLNVRDTLDSLISSLSTMGMGGSRELTRQILAAANKSNRKANEIQAKNNQGLDSAWNEYQGGYLDDLDKIGDQYQYKVGEANRGWGEKRQDAYHKMAGVYGDAGMDDKRSSYMKKGDGLNSFISNSAFVDPKYTGKARAMDTPELADYTQGIAQYSTAGVGAGAAGQPAVNNAMTPGNLAIKAVAVNDKDFGVKKKTESDLGYGV